MNLNSLPKQICIQSQLRSQRRFVSVLIVLISQALFFALTPSLVFACPLVAGLVDSNCDGRHRITVTGDSIVYGRGDELNDDQGGYVLRLRSQFPKSKISQLGYPGITSARLLSFYKKLFTKKPNSTTAKALANADLIIVDVGRNDYFNQNPPELTVTTIKRLMTFLASELKTRYSTTPIFVNTVLLPTTRSNERSFIDTVNSELIKLRSNKFPAYLRFDLVPSELIGTDGIHPTSAGYDAITTLAQEYILDDAQQRALAARPDRDSDGIYDLFERTRYLTDPSVADTDGDTIKDGAEIFRCKTDPLNSDTDGDGTSDGEEVDRGSNPKIPN